MAERVHRLSRCRRGHLAWVTAKDGSRRCGACHALRMRAYRRREKRQRRERERMARRIAYVPQRLAFAVARAMYEVWSEQKRGA